MEKEAGLSSKTINSLFEFLNISGTNSNILEQVKKLFERKSETGLAGIRELSEVLEYAYAQGVEESVLKLDLSIARGLDYYTGTVFETFIKSLPAYGSVMSGGRYDTLITRFLGKEMPAVGISVGIDRLFSGLLELGLIQKQKALTEVVVIVQDEETARMPALKIASQLRASGIATEIYLGTNIKIKKQFKYANQRNARFVIILGADEIKNNTASIKNMESGVQTDVPFAEITTKIKEL